MAVPNFWREVCFLSARFFLSRRKKKKKSQGGYIRRKKVDVLENSLPVLSKLCHSSSLAT